MSGNLTRRKLFHLAGGAAGTMVGSRRGWASQQQPQTPQAKPPRDSNRMLSSHPDPFPPLATRSTVSLVPGENRRKNVCEALLAIDEQIKPKLKKKEVRPHQAQLRFDE